MGCDLNTMLACCIKFLGLTLSASSTDRKKLRTVMLPNDGGEVAATECSNRA